MTNEIIKLLFSHNNQENLSKWTKDRAKNKHDISDFCHNYWQLFLPPLSNNHMFAYQETRKFFTWRAFLTFFYPFCIFNLDFANFFSNKSIFRKTIFPNFVQMHSGLFCNNMAHFQGILGGFIGQFFGHFLIFMYFFETFRTSFCLFWPLLNHFLTFLLFSSSQKLPLKWAKLM